MSATETVKAFLSALERLDFDGALVYLSEDIEYQNVPLPSDRGKQAVSQTLKRFSLFGDEFKVEIKNIAESNGVVLTERIDTLGGPGIRLEFWVCGTFEVKDGKITLWRDYFDTASVGAQIAKNLPGFSIALLKKLLPVG